MWEDVLLFHCAHGEQRSETSVARRNQPRGDLFVFGQLTELESIRQRANRVPSLDDLWAADVGQHRNEGLQLASFGFLAKLYTRKRRTDDYHEQPGQRGPTLNNSR